MLSLFGLGGRTSEKSMALGSPKPKDLNLNADEVRIIQRAWRRARGSRGDDEYNLPGLHTFQQIFMQMDEIRSVFGFTGFEDPGFIRHTTVFTNFLNNMISSLGRPAEFEQMCYDLGKVHARVRKGPSFRPEFWDIFASSIIACALDETDLKTQVTWRNIIQYMIYHMKEGYHAGVCAD